MNSLFKEIFGDADAVTYLFFAVLACMLVALFVIVLSAIVRALVYATNSLMSFLQGGNELTCEVSQQSVTSQSVADTGPRALGKHKDLVDLFLNLDSTCKSSLEEIFRFAAAFQGNLSSTSFIGSVRYDVSQILSIISAANGMIHDDSAGLYQAIFAELVPSDCLSIEDCRKQIERCDRQPIGLPVTAQLLQIVDRMNGTQLASTAAHIYMQLVVAGCDFHPNSFAVTAVKATYFDLLRPLISGPERSGHAEAERSLSCEKCRSSSHVLGVPEGATSEEIKEAYRDLAKVWHPDRFVADD